MTAGKSSQPDGNTINLQVIRPDNGETLPCVYYIHGGGMGFLSCFDGMFRGWESSSRRTDIRVSPHRLPAAQDHGYGVSQERVEA